MNPRILGLLSAGAYVATVWLANWALDRYGFVSVGFGLVAPAGVYFAGLAFTLRDTTQELLGRRAVIAAILIGAGASYVVNPRFAAASALAFLASELADFAVYTPLAERGWLRAVAASNLVGLVIDSALFLWLAFGSLDYLAGQIIGKVWVTALAVLLLAFARRLIGSPAPARA